MKTLRWFVSAATLFIGMCASLTPAQQANIDKLTNKLTDAATLVIDKETGKLLADPKTQGTQK